MREPFPNLQFLKLGGSLITHKARPHTARPDTLARLAEEIASARRQSGTRRQSDDLRLLLGHGSGSFGHVPASRHGTRQGVRSPEAWLGFVEVWREAAALNRVVMQALAAAGVPAMAFPPSAGVLANSGQVSAWNLDPLLAALAAGLVPVVFGDVVFDKALGGTILSTEDLFAHLAPLLRPQRVLLAGIEPGVWADYPACTRLVSEITPENLDALSPALGGSQATDVTGGMASKVRQSLELAQAVPGLDILIFSGDEAGSVEKALLGSWAGTRITKG